MNVETGRLVGAPKWLSNDEVADFFKEENLKAVPNEFTDLAGNLLDGKPEVMVDMETNSPLVDWAKSQRVGTKAQAKKWKKRKHRNKSK